MKLSAKLTGNKLGMQKIYLRADENMNRYTYVSIINNVLVINEKVNELEKNIFWLNLDKLDNKVPISIAEDKSLKSTVSLQKGDQEYIPDISVHAEGNRKLYIEIKDDKLTVSIDNKVAVEHLQLMNLESGNVYLESAWGEYGYSRRNLADDVYDAIFEELVITENTGTKNEKILFDARLQGIEKFVFDIESIWNSIINWFICYL